MDNIIRQLEQRFTGEQGHAGDMLCLIQSIMFNPEEEQPVVIKDLFEI